MTYILILLLIAFTLLSTRYITSKTIVTCVTLFCFSFWYICNMFTGFGITDAVFYHLFNTSKGASLDDLYPKIKVAALFILICISLIAYCIFSKKRDTTNKRDKIFNYAYLIIFSSILACPFSVNIFSSIKNEFFSHSDVSKVSQDYKRLSPMEGKKYNYVFIYAESLERTFSNLNNENHIPNLSELASNYAQFTNISQPSNMGFGWTMAGMVNTQCGIPLAMPQGNTGGNSSNFLPNAHCVASWLQDSGYHTEFIRGSQKEFAGGDKFLSQHGWARQDDLAYFVQNKLAKPEQISGWGVHDDVLLDHAWSEYERLSSQQQPFLLSLLTVNTHSPDGLVIPSCNTSVTKQEQPSMLSAVRCSDYLLTNFIKKIIKSPGFDKTIVVVISDHLMMENNASSLLHATEKNRKNNFIIIKKGLNNLKIENPGTLIDVWPTIIDIAENKDNSLGFGQNLIRNKESKFLKNIANGSGYNYIEYSSSLWGMPSLRDGMSKIGDEIQIGAQRYSLPVYSSISDDKLGSIWFEAFAKNIKSIIHSDNSFFYANLCKNIGIDDNSICAYIVNKNNITKIRISENGIIARKTFIQTSPIYNNDILGISSAPYFMDSGLSSMEAFNTLPSGINFISTKNKNNNIELSFQTCNNQKLDLDKIKKLIASAEDNFIIYAASDSINCGDISTSEQLSTLFSDPNFKGIDFRQQIIGFTSQGKAKSIRGYKEKPLDAFIDINKKTIYSLCEIFMDCAGKNP